MKNSLKNNLILSFAFMFLFIGCSESFLDINDENQLQAEIYFTKIDNLDLALNAVYSSLKSYDLFGSEYAPKVLEMLPHTSNQDWLGHIQWNQMATNEVTSDNVIVSDIWRGWYRVISRANDFINNAATYKESEYMKPGEEDQVDKMIGQASFIRAYANFTIVRLWGEGKATESSKLAAPLILKVPASQQEMATPRATVGEMYEQIISDFKVAESFLPDSWDENNIARVDKYAAKGFLGKVYLYLEDYPNAKSYLEQVVNGPFQLVSTDKYDGLFHGETEFSSESIWELNFQTDIVTHTWNGGTGTQIALITAPFGTGWSNVWPHDVNIRRFGSDPRLRVNALEPGVDQVTSGDGTTSILQKFPTEEGGLGWSYRKYVPLDYSVYSTNQNYGANYHIMRLAGAYLLYAEVLNKLNQDNDALEYVNKVRRRAYGKDINTPDPEVDFVGLSGTVLRDSIREERFRELFNEGQRWFDIVRWGIAAEEAAKYERVRSGTISFQDPKDNYLPIPRTELEQNSALTPSTGY